MGSTWKHHSLVISFCFESVLRRKKLKFTSLNLQKIKYKRGSFIKVEKGYQHIERAKTPYAKNLALCLSLTTMLYSDFAYQT